MLEKPNLADEIVMYQLESNFGLEISALEFLPIGNDQHAWAYRVHTESGDYFLKLRKRGARQAALIVPHELQRMGINQVVAPLEDAAGKLLVAIEDYVLILYPFVDGVSAWGMTLTLAQWQTWGEIVRRIHETSLSPKLNKAVPREVFGVNWLPTIYKVENVLARSEYSGEVARSMARMWREHKREIETCRRRYLALGALLAAKPRRSVLCHADIHTANIIIDRRGVIRIVDWDETVIAPKERDLMFFVLDGHSSKETAAFFKGYGDDQINWLALAYYKYDWVIQEFGDYGERVFLSTELGEKDLQSSLREFERLFATDDVIDRAHQAFAKFGEMYPDLQADIG